MKFSCALFFLLFFLETTAFTQQTYFIKYKDSVSREVLSQKVESQKIFPVSKSIPIASINYKVNWFAKGLAKDVPGLQNIIKITFPSIVNKESILNLSTVDSDIEYVQENNIYKTDAVPNDSLVGEQWALQRINAFDAWKVTTGSDTVLLGIIDTGIDYLHPDLKNKIYMNPGEIGIDQFGRDKRTNRIDDDNNGFVDDYMGWDFVDRVGFPFDTLGGDFLDWDNNPRDDYGHGTYVSGIAGAQTNNLIGIAGVAPNIKLMNIRAFDPTGNGEEDDVAAAILYAVKMGCKVINMSFGDESFSMVLRDVIRYAYSRNVVLVASSGNSGSSLPHYPSGYSEVICVGNSTPEDYTASSSNYGSTLDLVAPGTSIITTEKGGGYASINGTSAAAPFVSAAASLILSVKNFSNEEVKQILKSSCDDIGDPGWDIKSGSGRLNINKALNVLAPANIKINSPYQDFSTYKDTLNINLTTLSPYFIKYDLYIGVGLNPKEWTLLKGNQQNQVFKENVLSLPLKQLADSVYTIRLAVTLTSGYQTEERTNFYIQRTPPAIELVGLGSAYYGNISTIVGELYTNQRSVTRMFYRKSGEIDFNFITLDGFNTNNQFVKNYHYGILPKSSVQPNSVYEVYFEAENLAGLKSILKDSTAYFLVNTDKSTSPVSYNLLDYKLPKGEIFESPVNFLSGTKNEILMQQFYPSQDLYYSLFKMENNNLVKYTGDSLKNKFPRFAGDLNNNGKIDLISSNRFQGFIDEQTTSGTFNFTNIKKDTTGNFFPVYVNDIDGDGSFELVTNFNNEKYIAYKVNNDLSLTLIDTLKNYSYINSTENNIGVDNSLTNNIVSADINNDGVKELWFVDYDGDLMSYKYLSGHFVKGDSVIERYSLSGLYSNSISAGDFDGDGKDDIAVLYSVSGNIAPLFWLKIYSYKNNKIETIFEKLFIDQSAEFIGFTFNKAEQSIKFSDIDNDNKAELIVNIFPNSFIFKNNSGNDDLIFFKEGTNNSSIFVGDLNQNGVKDIAFQESDGYHFYEFGISNQAISPSSVKGYSISAHSVHLEWQSESTFFYIYKGLTPQNLTLIDSSFTNSYIDNSVNDTTTYYYGIKSIDPSKPDSVSSMSDIVKVFVHAPAKMISVVSNSKNSLTVTFSNKVKNTIENLEAFELKGVGFPNSISPSSQYSYLLNFKNDIPIGLNTLILKSISDFFNSPIANDSISFSIVGNAESSFFVISSHEIINPFRIKIVFSLPVDPTTAVNINNYIFQPENNVESVEIDPVSQNTVYLNLIKKRPIGSLGIQYRLKINNLISSSSSGNLKIASESGSYIILTSFARDLSDVYVYPSPVKINENSEITFANLPQRAKITIFTINGNKVNELAETNGDGGLSFNLKDFNNQTLSSGVYLYRIIRLDEQNNELEEKIGKFAVIK